MFINRKGTKQTWFYLRTLPQPKTLSQKTNAHRQNVLSKTHYPSQIQAALKWHRQNVQVALLDLELVDEHDVVEVAIDDKDVDAVKEILGCTQKPFFLLEESLPVTSCYFWAPLTSS